MFYFVVPRIVDEAELQVLLYLDHPFHGGPQGKHGISGSFIYHRSKLVTDISGRILFLILFINTRSMTCSEVAHNTCCAGLITFNCTWFFFFGIAMYTDFFRSVGITPISWLMWRSFVISMILNSPRAVSISDDMSSGPAAWPFYLFEGLLNFLLKNLGTFVIIDDKKKKKSKKR